LSRRPALDTLLAQILLLSLNMHNRRANAPKRQIVLRRLVLAGLFSSFPAIAATPPPATAPAAPPAETVQAQSGFREEVSVGFVLVPTVVRTKGGYVNDLEKEDFRLFVDGARVPIESFERGSGSPVSLVFLQDLSGSMGVASKLEASRMAVTYFLDQQQAGDQYAIASFSGDLVQVDVPFTSDPQPLRESVAAWEASGTTAINNAVAWLPEIAAEQMSFKRAAILITDGVDNKSSMTAEQARDAVRKAELPVYVLGLDAGSPYVLGEDGKKVWKLADTLNLLAALTGGRYYPIDGPYAMKEACAAIADDLRHQYVLGFSTRGSEGTRAYHSVRVEVGTRSQTVSFRRGYRGSTPSAAAAAAK